MGRERQRKHGPVSGLGGKIDVGKSEDRRNYV